MFIYSVLQLYNFIMSILVVSVMNGTNGTNYVLTSDRSELGSNLFDRYDILLHILVLNNNEAGETHACTVAGIESTNIQNTQVDLFLMFLSHSWDRHDNDDADPVYCPYDPASRHSGASSPGD